jgi:hypothetical protein
MSSTGNPRGRIDAGAVLTPHLSNGKDAGAAGLSARRRPPHSHREAESTAMHQRSRSSSHPAFAIRSAPGGRSS